MNFTDKLEALTEIAKTRSMALDQYLKLNALDQTDTDKLATNAAKAWEAVAKHWENYIESVEKRS